MNSLLSTFLWTACITPFNYSGSSIDYISLHRLLFMQSEANNVIMLLGSTGEGLSLSDSEKRTLVKFVCGLKLNTKIVVCVPGVNLHQTLEWLDFCNTMPIHGYLITTPIYAKPGIIGQTLWFEKLLEVVRVPSMLYNVPSRAGINLHVETVRNLSGHKNFWAIKDSSGTVNTLIAYRKAAPNIKVFCGDDNIAFDMTDCGATGLVSVASNLWPRVAHNYIKKCIFLFKKIKESKKSASVRIIKNNVKSLSNAWQLACKSLFIASNPIPVKVFMNDIGLIRYKTVRLPLSIRDLSPLKRRC